MARPKKFDPDEALGQAMALFWAKGFAGSTPQALGTCMGIGRGSLYNAFDSKRALFDRALERYRDRECAPLLAILAEPGPVKKRIRKLLLTIVETDLGDPERRGCFGVNVAVEMSAQDEAARELVTALFAQTTRHLKAAIEEGQRTGEIDTAQDASTLASFLLNSMIGMRVLGKVEKDDKRLRRIVDTAMNVL
ncbi:Transcriptional regulator, TetR family [Labilithrix luteola]|uniref:Transcriptional regulator, TetR family n=1 Tax=Labilithrix luteola TaxID=1391654 RepID=A0A0K1Q4A4_9BACT|nr:TetR/AcrR family transcriptional regulator [Labilithrix luteola]AKV00569.1 Transcriptional regulator, TetR family [Labilithrix luteola]